jgi:outer membrane protein assembly factor BamB
MAVMKRPGLNLGMWIPVVLGVFAGAALVWWLRGPDSPLELRVPGTDHAPDSTTGSRPNPVLAGQLIQADGLPAELAGSWPGFRGPNRDGISRETTPLSREWRAGEPRELWAIDVGEGYAGAAVLNGRVYVMDYDQERKQDALRCLSLADGKEIWRYAYPVAVKRNHGMSRTVPFVTGELVLAIGPMCHVVCLDAVTGELRWSIDLVQEHGATVPPWYAGQCLLIDDGKVILAPGGPDALLIAAELETGAVLWKTPNPRDWKMTHSSVMPAEIDGRRMYVYCANNGVAGVNANDGSLLWETPDWKISIANVPSPVILDGGRIFLSGGYNAGSLMLQLKAEGESFAVETLFRLPAEIFGSTQHTPILHENHIYGTRADGRFVCLTLDGNPVWTSDSGQQFGLGPYLMANGLIYALNDSGLLRLIEARSDRYSLLSQAKVLNGRESWGPLALAGGRLIARDLTRMVCLDVTPRM